MDNSCDPFAPLTNAERVDASRQSSQIPDAKASKLISPPVDVEGGALAAARLFGRKPDDIWTYRTADGEIAFHAARWNDGDGAKTFRPVSWCEGVGWDFKAWPENRPLYNLLAICNQPGVLVVVCEGEKAADAAARIFSDSVATTSSGGAGAASKSDWSALAGRPVIIWPDHDEAGEKYARAVATILADLGAEVSILDPAALVAQINTPNPDGFDAANALAESADISELRDLVAALTKPYDPEPAYRSFGAYKMDARGLHVEAAEGHGANKHMVVRWVSAPFEVIGACRDAHGGTWGKMLRWRDGDGRQHARHIADGALHGDASTLCAQFADFGLRIARSGQRHFADYLSGACVDRRVRLVSRTGWHEIEGQFVFVLPVESIGASGAERVMLDTAAHALYDVRGSAEAWRDSVARLARGHVLPVLAISAALAGPLLELAGMEGGGLHFWGPSSKGKTTLLQMAGSVWGRGESGGYVRTWRATANGLEGAAAGATDTALVLDEIGQVDGREVGAVIYALANGLGKARAARDGGLREAKTWRVIVISSGETTVEAKQAEDRGRRARAGQLVRMLDIPAQRAFGVFDNPGPDGDAAAFAKACKLAAASTYGTAGPAFVRRLLSNGVTGDDVRRLMRSFVAAQVPAGADGQIDRAAHRLGLIAAAGELATLFGLTGWREGEATEAAAWALAEWINARGGTEPAEISQAIATVRHFLEAHGEARFDNLDDPDARPVPNRAGWRKGTGEERRWFIPPEIWKVEVCAGIDAEAVARVLAQRGMLEKAADGLQPVKRIAGRPQRVRVITPRIFDGGEA